MSITNRFPIMLWAIPVVAVAVSTALAIRPGTWIHTNEADFEPGTFENTVVTNLGDVRLAAGTTTVGDLPEEARIVYDLARDAGGVLYIAAGPEAKLMKRTDGGIEQVLALEGAQVFALDVFDGELLVAASGAQSRLAVLREDDAGPALQDLHIFEDVRYIWDVLVDGDVVYLATGTDGKVLRVDLTRRDEPHVTEVLTAKQANVLCLARDAAGRIFAGTDTDGLVYRIEFDDAGEPTPFVVYDAAEPEIGALAIGDDGVVYAGTADADQARPGRLEEAVSEEKGRPTAQTPADKQPEPGEQQQLDPPALKPLDDQPEPAKAPDATAPMPDAEPVEQRSPADPPSPDAQPENNASRRSDANRPPLPTAWAGVKGANDGANTPEAPAANKPTTDQRDRLRDVIRERLTAARGSGILRAGPHTSQRQVRQGAKPKTPPDSAGAATVPKQGNAIYSIRLDGFVTEVFRESVMVLRLHIDGSKLLVATGNEGHVFQVDTAKQETTILTDLEPEQVMTVIPVPADGDDQRDLILLGTANPATLVELDRHLATDGTYTSPVLDAAQISLWGAFKLTGAVPQGASLQVLTRSGNVDDPDNADWAPWSEPIDVAQPGDTDPLAPIELSVETVPARFLQYKLMLTGDGQTTATVGHVEIFYVTPNIKPQIASIVGKYPEAVQPRSGGGASDHNVNQPPAPMTKLNLEWQASDANQDDLIYTLEYKPAGQDQWLGLEDDLRQTNYEWDTQRVPDGRYRVRVSASDRAHNTPDMARTAQRDSEPVVIDNTPPRVLDPQTIIEPDGQVHVTFAAQDELSPIQRVQWATDSVEDFQAALPTDLIYDSTRETFNITITDLAPGPHAVTIRVIDAQNNASVQSVFVLVPAQGN
ncbi:MAG: hypothetical protein CMJ21_01670 [Phycisphaerae bacterium]|nr:hypothetical protein [Phycisphaerae bacterium]